MTSFKKRKYTDPIIGKHDNNISKDWYIFFRFKHEGKILKFKRREGVNRIKDLQERLNAIEELLIEIKFDLKNGWNPVLDPKRENDYNPYLNSLPKSTSPMKQKLQPKRPTKEMIYLKYYNS